MRRRAVFLALAAGGVIILAGQFYEHWVLLIPFSFLTLGMLIRYGVVFDSRIFSRGLSTAMLVLCGVWIGTLICYHHGYAIIAFSIPPALFIVAKYDDGSFRISLPSLGVMFSPSFTLFPEKALASSIVIVFTAAIADEVVAQKAATSSGPWMGDASVDHVPGGGIAIPGRRVISTAILLYFHGVQGCLLVDAYSRLRRRARATI